MLDNQIDNPFAGVIIDFVVLPASDSWHNVAHQRKVNPLFVPCPRLRLKAQAGEMNVVNVVVHVIRADELKLLSSKDGLDKDDNKEIQGQESDKKIPAFLWKLFYRCYGKEGGLTITMLVNTWTDIPREYGSLDLHFVELCTGAPALYSAEPLYREHRPYASWLVDLNHSACAEYSALTNKMKSCTNFSLSGDGRFATIKTIAGGETYLEVWSLKDSDTARKLPVVSKKKGDSPDVRDDRTRWDTDADSGEDSTVPHQSEVAIFQCNWDDTKASDMQTFGIAYIGQAIS
ncbi:MAG: hypothetical protein J3R72DRAFT_485192 [Linnemannia gamsii]|nr:MAG: hypothetical protein J3R72DRAFT_485192 [Linnemannia gamsii]